MNLHPGPYPPTLLPDWVLAPVYNDRVSNHLSLWPSQPNANISLSFPTSLPHPRVSVAQTLVDLTLPKPPHQFTAEPAVKELPFAVIKPKAIRLYDIHIGVESQLPVSNRSVGFGELYRGSSSNAFPYSPSIVSFGCQNLKTDVKNPPLASQRDEVSALFPSQCLLNSTHSTKHDKQLKPFCTCYQKGRADLGYKECCAQTQTNAQSLHPFFLGFPGQSPTQALPRGGISNIFDDYASLISNQHFPQNKLFTNNERQSIATPEQNTNPWSRGHTGKQKGDGFLALPSTLATYKNWSNVLQLSQRNGDRHPSHGNAGLDHSKMPFLAHEQTKLHRNQNCNHNSNILSFLNPINVKGRPNNQGHQKYFLHPWDSLQKHKDSRERQFLEKPFYKDEERKNHGLVFPSTMTNVNSSYSNQINAKPEEAKSTGKRALITKRSVKVNDVSKCLNRPSIFKKAFNKKSRGKTNRRFPHQGCSNVLEPRGANKMYPFQDGCHRVVSVSPFSETARQGEGHVPGANSSERKVFRCPQCRYITDRKNNLKRHIVTMHHTSNKTLECCGIAFQSKAALRDHNSVFHKGGYRCSLCARNFCRKALLRRHLTVHSGQKDFFCEQCGYATSHKSNLERHQKVHVKREEGVKELEEVCYAGTNHNVRRTDMNERSNSTIYSDAAPTKYLNAPSRSAIPEKGLTFSNSLGRGHSYNGNTFMQENRMPYDHLNLGLGLSRVNNDSTCLVKPLLDYKKDTKNVGNIGFKNEFISPERETCEPTLTRNSRQEIYDETLFQKFDKSKHPIISRNRKGHRTRGPLFKRIRETYLNHTRPRTKPRTEHQQKSCLREEKMEGLQGAQNDLKPSDILGISFENNNHNLDHQGNNPKQDNNINPSADELTNLKRNIEESIPSQDNERNDSQSIDAARENEVEFSPLQLSSKSTSQHALQSAGLRSAVKRPKHELQRKLCDVVYCCPECGAEFPTQLKLGEHRCSPTANTSQFYLPLVKSYQKERI